MNRLGEFLQELCESHDQIEIYWPYVFDEEMNFSMIDLYEYDLSFQDILRRNQHMFQDTGFAFDIGERRQAILKRGKLISMYDQKYVEKECYPFLILYYLQKGWKLVYMGNNHGMVFKGGLRLSINVING